MSGMRAQNEYRKKGVALITVICMMAVFMALSLAALLAASILATNTEKNLYREQARVASVTLMKRCEADLLDNEETSLQEYLQENMSVFENGGTWMYYDETAGIDVAGYIRRFTLPQGVADDEPSCSIEMYWMADGVVMNDHERDLQTRCSTVTLKITANAVCNDETYVVSQNFGLIADELDDGSFEFHWYVVGVK